MSRIAIICANSPVVQHLHKCGILSVLPNNLPTNKLNYHTCNSTARNNVINNNSLSVRFASTNIVKSPYPPINVPKKNLVEYLWKDLGDREELPAAVSSTFSLYHLNYKLVKLF